MVKFGRYGKNRLYIPETEFVISSKKWNSVLPVILVPGGNYRLVFPSDGTRNLEILISDGYNERQYFQLEWLDVPTTTAIALAATPAFDAITTSNVVVGAPLTFQVDFSNYNGGSSEIIIPGNLTVPMTVYDDEAELIHIILDKSGCFLERVEAQIVGR